MSNSLFDEVLNLAGGAVDACGWADSALSKVMVNKLVQCTRNRPHPWSTASDYTSWKSLTDRTFQARHLPAAAPGIQPDPAKIDVLFARPDGTQTLSKKSTCLFPAFAQYLTDGFIRTDPNNRAKTTSNHEIDLCPLYGRNEAQTLILRKNDNSQGFRGRLKSQFILAEEYPIFLYLPDGTVKPEFSDLDHPLVSNPTPPGAQLPTLFAVGGDRANSTPVTSMMNTLLLREHNRIAGELEKQNPNWDDERVFQTARNIMIPMFIKIVVEQYINHISPTPFNFVADPSVAWTANWNRPNWVTAEFSLLYRWHSLMPDVIDWQGSAISIAKFGLNNQPLLDVGLEMAFAIAAAQPAAALGALNTNAALLPLEQSAVRQARSNHLDTYNAYRVHFGLQRAGSFTDISSDRRIVAILQSLYSNVEDVEFYPGLFSEDREPKSPLPGLLLRMVGVDAFSQALTNPLLSEHVFNEKTFTPWGFQLIKNTGCLGDLLVRQGAKIHPKAVTMTQPSWSYGWDMP
jgi:heme peroxidase